MDYFAKKSELIKSCKWRESLTFKNRRENTGFLGEHIPFLEKKTAFLTNLNGRFSIDLCFNCTITTVEKTILFIRGHKTR